MKLKHILNRIDQRRSELPDEVGALSDRALSKSAGLTGDAIRNMRRLVEKDADAVGGANAMTISALAAVLETTESWIIHGTEATPDSVSMKMAQLSKQDPAAFALVVGLLDILLKQQDENLTSDQ